MRQRASCSAVSSLVTPRLAIWPPPEVAQLYDRLPAMYRHTRTNSEAACRASLSRLRSCSANFINTYRVNE